MTFRNLTVWIDYRMKAGSKEPRWKALRARIKHGSFVGADLTRQGITDPVQCILESLTKLIHDGVTGGIVSFEFDPLLIEKGCVDCSYQITNGQANLLEVNLTGGSNDRRSIV